MRIRALDASGKAISGAQIKVSTPESRYVISGKTRPMVFLRSRGFSLKMLGQLFQRLPPAFDFTPMPGLDALTIEATYGKETTIRHNVKPSSSFDLHFVGASAEKARSRRTLVFAIFGALVVASAAGLLLWRKQAAPVTATAMEGATYIGSAPTGKPLLVVFIHGLFGSAWETWTATPQAQPSDARSLPALLSTDPSLKDLLDVMVFQYATPKWSDAARLPDLAEQLRGELEANDVWNKYSQVIFVGHSMGGIVIREFLTHHREYIPRVPMIYLYATPTNGADIAKAAEVISKNPQLNGLLPIQNNDFLSSLSNAWVDDASLKNLPTYCAYESLPIGGVVVVPRQSATAGCNRSYDPMDSDHVNIVKPEGLRDPRYSRLATAIRKTLASASITPKV